jgi:hypothetical protein
LVRAGEEGVATAVVAAVALFAGAGIAAADSS